MISARPQAAWMNGRLVPFDEARVPIEDRGVQFAESLYEVVPITGGETRMLAIHAQRMRAGARELGLLAGVPEDADWTRISAALLEADPVEEGLLYAQLTGGETRRAHLAADAPVPSFWAYVRAHRFPREGDVERGIRAITRPDPRWARCDLKTIMLLPAVMAKREAQAVGAGEVVFLGDGGEVREGGSSNVLLLEGRTLVTPAQTHHLLPGITGPLIQRLAEGAGLEVRSDHVTAARLRAADEIMVASTTFLLMPVTHLDGHPIGTGAAGPVATDLARRLRADLGL